MLALLMTAVSGAWADELTVHEGDGTLTNQYVPVYGDYCDAYLKCEMVMPATELSAMNGSEISAMTFYSSSTSVSWGSASFQVFLNEVSSTAIGGFSGPGTVVYEGALSIVGGEMTVTFTTPYTYNGGNLLIGVYNTANGSYVQSNWYGETVSGASVQGHNYTEPAYIESTQRNFLPKTTFTYSAPAAPAGIDLTPDATRKVWTLAEMPAYDVELQVEYYPGMFTFGGDAIEGGTVEVVGLTGDALPAGFEKDAEGNIYVAKGTTFTVKATPEEGYHFVCWSDDQTNTNPEREISMPADGSDLSLSATFAENEYDITFSEGTNPDPENPEWTATPNPAKTKQTVTVTYSGSKKVIGVKAEKKVAGKAAAEATAEDKDKLICTEGHIHAYGEDAECTATRVAKIIYLGTTGHATYSHGLALAMEDVSENTLSWDNSGSNNGGKTAAEWCSAWNTSKPVKDAEWLLASQTQWNYMMGANGAGSYTALRDGFSSVGGSNLRWSEGYSYYWSSTEEGELAESYNFNGGYWSSGYKNTGGDLLVRACLAF